MNILTSRLNDMASIKLARAKNMVILKDYKE